MNSYTKITLILLLSSLTTLIHTKKKSAAEMAQYHKETAETARTVASFSFTSLITNGFFEMLYRELDKKEHVPTSWQFARRINRPLMGVAGVFLIGAACVAQHHTDEYVKNEEATKWFWQR